MQSKRIAAIDLGTNSFHLVIVELKDIRNLNSIKEIESNNSFEVLYRQKEIVRINVGSNGETKNLKPEGIDRALSALKKFKEKIDEYGAITHAIATSAIREADNKDEFIKFVKDNLDIEIKVVSGFEEARLIYLGVLQGLKIYDKQILLIDIGGGSTELLIGKQGKVLYASSFKLGAVRFTQKFFGGGKTFPKDKKKECENFVIEILNANLMPIKTLGFEQVIGTSGQMQSIARLLYSTENEKSELKSFNDVIFNRKQFDKISKRILKFKTLEEVKSISLLDEKRAEIIIPGTLILKAILETLNIDEVTVSNYALREGIIIDAVEKNFISDFEIYPVHLPQSSQINNRTKRVLELAKFYNVDLRHAYQVRKIALTLFDELKFLHQLDEKYKEYLEYAAILHDIGYRIDAKKHHKFSYFIIKNSGLVGFDDAELNLIANIARYHRKALPNKKHNNFRDLKEFEKRLVQILSGILRLSDGLEKTHNALINDIKVLNHNDDNLVTVILRYLTYLPHEELNAAEKRKKVLEDLFNIKIDFKLERIAFE